MLFLFACLSTLLGIILNKLYYKAKPHASIFMGWRMVAVRSHLWILFWRYIILDFLIAWHQK